MRQGCVLEPSLFCRAIDWIIAHMKGLSHFKVGDYKFTDLHYADDIALPATTVQDITASLSGFAEASRTMELNVLWPKTKVQSLGTGPLASGVSIGGQQVEHVDQFCYLGSVIDSSGRCRPDILRRMGIASSSVNSVESLVAI